MNDFTFKTGMASRLGNGTVAIIDGVTRIDGDKSAEFRVVVSSNDKYRHCDGLCTLDVKNLLTMNGADFLRMNAVEQAVTLAAIAAYRNWLDGTKSMLDGILAFVDSETLRSQF